MRRLSVCRELSALGVKEPQYHFVAFIMKATVCAKVLEKGQETTIPTRSDQLGHDKGITGAQQGHNKILSLIAETLKSVFLHWRNNAKSRRKQ